jgi:hypothetical protein
MFSKPLFGLYHGMLTGSQLLRQVLTGSYDACLSSTSFVSRTINRFPQRNGSCTDLTVQLAFLRRQGFQIKTFPSMMPAATNDGSETISNIQASPRTMGRTIC